MSSETERRSESGQDGFANVVVLAGLLAVSGLLTVSMTLSRETATMAQALVGRLHDEVATSTLAAATWTAIERSTLPLPLDAASKSIGATDTLSVAIDPEGGKLNPLIARSDVMGRYGRGLPSPEARRLFASAQSTTPREEAYFFDLVKTLLTLDGDRLRDFSLYNPLAGIDPAHATANVLKAIPDLSAADVSAILNRADGEPFGVQSAYFNAQTSRYSIVVRITHSDGTFFERSIPIELSTTGAVLLLGPAP